MHIEEQSNEGPRLEWKQKYENETKQNKRNAKEIQHDVCKPPGRYEFAPLKANQPWRANQHEHACFGLPSHWSFPSRSGILSSYIPGDESLQQERVLFTHLIIVSAKTEGDKRSEKQCRDNVTSFHIQLPCERENNNLRTILPTASVPFSQLTITKE